MAERNMCEGSSLKHLASYAVPLILGNLFQLAYNMVDSIIAGRFIGRDALAATGMAAPIMNILILGISGLCVGSGIMMSAFYGASDKDKLKKEMTTMSLFGLCFSLAIVLLAQALTPWLLNVLNVPKDVKAMTSTYLRIIFLGCPFTFFYNSLSSALKAIGDSKTPVRFLMFASVLNASLDIIFIGFLGFGIVCSAVTTVIAQAVSALLTALYIYRKEPLLHVDLKALKIDGKLLKDTLKIGGVTALQQSVQPVGKLLIQGCVNTLGVNVIAAYNAVTRVDDFACTPEQSVSHAVTTFVAQNRGAGKKERIRKGFRSGLLLEVCYFVIIFTVAQVFKRPIMSLFVTGEGSAEIIGTGCEYLSLMAFFYILPGLTNCIQGFFRGMGKVKITLISTAIQTTGRVVFTFILVPKMGITGIALSCALGWSCMILFEYSYYLLSRKKLGLI